MQAAEAQPDADVTVIPPAPEFHAPKSTVRQEAPQHRDAPSAAKKAPANNSRANTVSPPAAAKTAPQRKSPPRPAASPPAPPAADDAEEDFWKYVD